MDLAHELKSFLADLTSEQRLLLVDCLDSEQHVRLHRILQFLATDSVPSDRSTKGPPS